MTTPPPPSAPGTGLIWSEIKQLWDIGLQDYVSDLWNVIDFVTNALYVATIALRVVAYNQVCYWLEKLLFCSVKKTWAVNAAMCAITII